MTAQRIRHMQALAFFIRTFQHTHGYSPAAVDIARVYGVHDSTASKWLCQLERAKVIKRGNGIRQHIEVRI